MNAYICMRSASGIVHHGRRRAEQLVPVDRDGIGGGGLTEYMNRELDGGQFPLSQLVVFVAARVFHSV